MNKTEHHRLPNTMLTEHLLVTSNVHGVGRSVVPELDFTVTLRFVSHELYIDRKTCQCHCF